MLFTSAAFLLFVACSVALHWALPSQRARLCVLLAASFWFYAAHHWPSLLLLVGFILVNYALGRLQDGKRSRALLSLAVCANLLALGWFKYAGFLAGIAAALLHAQVPRPPAYLPLGISFFTFQVVAYQVDVYRGTIRAERSLLVFAVFKCFFAQLVAGPIVRAREFLPQLRERRRFDAGGFHHGLFLVVAGLALKVGVADVLGQFVARDFRDPAALATTAAWSGAWAFAFQLYADFWGYSTMAVGIGLLFGLELPLNFHDPFLSASLREFWRRWHVTLSTWFRDYLYIPLGGNRRAANRNLLVTMAVAGLWHGAGFTFLLWGAAHGAWLALERRLAFWERLPRPARVLLVFQGVAVLFVVFRAPTLQAAATYLSRLFLPPYSIEPMPALLAGWLLGFALLMSPLAALIADRRFLALRSRWQVAATSALIFFALAHAGAQIDFIYFTF
ncbi:MAG TPA: MBOAT family O-acyltransferase [Myxococcales bacterium]|nr:MBOAT family O-acyltransferase [Myxococcales bacterium]